MPGLEEPDGVAHGHGERPALPQEYDEWLDGLVEVAVQLLLRRSHVVQDHPLHRVQQRDAPRVGAGDGALGVPEEGGTFGSLDTKKRLLAVDHW